jgi:FkbM family methyltransferase
MRWDLERIKPLAAAVTHPTLTARYLTYIYGQDGAGLGWWMRPQLDRQARVELAMALLSREDLVYEFDGGGFHWVARAGDDIAGQLLLHGEYTATEVRELTAWLREHRPRPGAWVVEVGANIGTTTVPLADEGWCVLAVEPVPVTFSLLQRNVAANGFVDRVRTRQAAVAVEAGTATMIVSHSLGRSHVAGHGHTPPSAFAEVKVPAVPLVDLLQDLTPADVAWVWCDTDGSERNVIESGAALWEDGVPLYAEMSKEYGTEPLAETFFTSFIPGETEGGSERPIRELRGYLAGLPAIENCLLLP